ncbi:MAG: ferredoxin family protein [Candidatus Thorarchaeota archaeon]
MNEKAYAFPDFGITNPITFNPKICIGCNKCIEVCQVDIFIPNPENKRPPIVLFPTECWYCGTCVNECPKPGAIKLNPLLMNRVYWKRKNKNEK